MSTKGAISRLSGARLGVNEIVFAGLGAHEQLVRFPKMLKLCYVTNPVNVLPAHGDTPIYFIRVLRDGDDLTPQYASGETLHDRISRSETVRWNTFAYPVHPLHPLLALVTSHPFDGTEYGEPAGFVEWRIKSADCCIDDA